VANGVSVRMAVLYLLLGGAELTTTGLTTTGLTTTGLTTTGLTTADVTR
jgi:hypothetical protein